MDNQEWIAYIMFPNSNRVRTIIAPASEMAAKMHVYKVVGTKPLGDLRRGAFPFGQVPIGYSFMVFKHQHTRQQLNYLRIATKRLNDEYHCRFDIHKPRTGLDRLEVVRLA